MVVDGRADREGNHEKASRTIVQALLGIDTHARLEEHKT
jgi:hypothetical protein